MSLNFLPLFSKVKYLMSLTWLPLNNKKVSANVKVCIPMIPYSFSFPGANLQAMLRAMELQGGPRSDSDSSGSIEMWGLCALINCHYA